MINFYTLISKSLTIIDGVIVCSSHIKRIVDRNRFIHNIISSKRNRTNNERINRYSKGNDT